MFNRQTIYALNKFDGGAIIYDDAFGKINRLTVSDFDSVKEFRKWKNWDKMKKQSEQRKDNVHRNHTFSLTDQENEIGAVPSSEESMIADWGRLQEIQQAKSIVAQIQSIVTEKQFRRIWLYYAECLNLDQIAEIEGTTHQAVSDSICRARCKLTKYFNI